MGKACLPEFLPVEISGSKVVRVVSVDPEVFVLQIRQREVISTHDSDEERIHKKHAQFMRDFLRLLAVRESNLTEIIGA